MKLSVIVVFHNMRREAKRTLYTLSSHYQKIAPDQYEVIAIDSNSEHALHWQKFAGIQNFRYFNIQVNNPSPCRAMNIGIAAARSDKVLCLIDGARMLSPGILNASLQLFKAYPQAYIHTLSFHLGHQLQNIAMQNGYDQQFEDRLLASVPWQQDGYQLFKIASLALSSAGGYLAPINESNCFAIDKAHLKRLNGFDESFISPGGGLVNLDLHGRLMQDSQVQPWLLLGEGSFHQFHGGVATNRADNRDLIQSFKQEYRRIRGRAFQNNTIESAYFGRIHPLSRPFLTGLA